MKLKAQIKAIPKHWLFPIFLLVTSIGYTFARPSKIPLLATARKMLSGQPESDENQTKLPD
jgi:hypothetical protein